jgi:TetR/AcrR family transcriptional repressor of nem operon
MNKKEEIIITAANLIHEHGYHNIGIKSILDELSIPKGSFYYYFKSKEDLGLSIIELYIQDNKDYISQCEISIEGIKKYFNIFFDRMKTMELKKGCPIGNMILELSDENESFRLKLLEWYQVTEEWISNILIYNKIDNAKNKSKALIASFEGTILLSKLDKDTCNFDIFNKHTFYTIIGQAKENNNER